MSGARPRSYLAPVGKYITLFRKTFAFWKLSLCVQRYRGMITVVDECTRVIMVLAMGQVLHHESQLLVGLKVIPVIRVNTVRHRLA
jgi:hypothetical protein